MPHRLTFLPPMLPTLVEAAPAGDDWLHEIKHDGFRTQIVIESGQARAFSRSGHDWSERYGPLCRAAESLGAAEAILDGEVMVQDDAGRSDFAALQGAIARTPERLVFMAFDLLHDGRDLRGVRLEDRRGRLEELIGGNDPGRPIQFSGHVEGGGPAFFAAVEGLELEGVVSKRKGSRYRGGYAKAWVKTKTVAESEFVVIAVERGDKAPHAILAREGQGGQLELVGPAMVNLPDPERTRFWTAIEGLKTDRAPVAMTKPRQGSFVQPELRVRARYLRGEERLRHAVVLGLVEAPDAAAASPTPIPATKRGGGEPSYKKPRLPEKAALVNYYREVAPLVLAFAGRRPLNLFRCTAGHCFFQRNRAHPASGEAFAPPIRFLPIAQKNGRTEDYLWIDDEAGVIACAEADAIEFHGWGAPVADVERPDRIAFDLDPGEGTAFEEVKAAASTMRQVLDGIGLASFPMLSGGKGIHVIVPLTPAAEWQVVRAFAHRICAALASAEPALFTVALPKAERTGRIFLDYLRNQRTATAVMPYSLRARPGAPVAAPIAWDELDEIRRASRFAIGDAALLLKRARSRALRGWGEAEQILPRLA